ncbi:hypothetical protein [Cetobacterium sp.]|uniref:hypothetical protein n=1 Tax=Cetobacterium sp. TaxID=2071632 RepID=UPI003EE427A8
MDINDEIVLEKLMEAKLIKSHGEEFENIFVAIMKRVNSNFLKISPYGNIGDRKNDGYIPSEGIFYQVFGPKEYTSSAVTSAKTKIEEDFYTLKNHCQNNDWCSINSWNFVFNDKTHGVSPILAKKVSDLENKTGIKCNIMGIEDIMLLFENLKPLHKHRLVGLGNFNNQNIINFDFEIFSNIFNYFKKNIDIIEIHKKLSSENYNVDPNLEKKIKFNNLDDERSKELLVHNEFVYQLDDFLTFEPDFALIGKEKFISLYEEAKNIYSDSNDIYDFILNYSYPKTNLSLQDVTIYNSHIKILMAKYFEGCDIFVPVPKNK